MNEKQFNAFCKKLPATTYVKQWGESHVWKVGGKVFAIGGWEDSDEDEFAISFKVSDMNFEIL
ncbi:MAG: MmcQ/YjbR family DNA-binding protein, partial [Candidatus Obscuribacter sp.]|nr:MmcQ/YjbR family DNA-binding protein [Candidatus Obscuribacter sp.]